MQLLNLYRNLSRPSIELGSSAFQVIAIPGYPHHRLGKDGTGAPALLIFIARVGAQVPGPVVLQHVSVQHRVRCRLLVGDESSEAEFTVVRCISPERTLREYFLRIAEVTISQLGQTPSRAQVTSAIQRLTELFRAFELPSRKTAQGLWAELVLIAYATDPETLVAAWHRDPDEGFDFADGRSRVEVKSFSQHGRAHSFSLRQVRPGPGVDVVIASLRAERSAGGVTLADVIGTIGSRGLTPSALFKVQDVVARSLGDSAISALTFAFDLERARSSLHFFDAAAVPAIDPHLPLGVTNVRFDAILDEAQALTSDVLVARDHLFVAVIPS